jgi:hypothetical protein
MEAPLSDHDGVRRFYVILNAATGQQLFLKMNLTRDQADAVCDELNEAFWCGSKGEPSQ